jgi:hypothetical protein
LAIASEALFVFDGNKTTNSRIGTMRFDNYGDSIASLSSVRDGANDAGALAFYTQVAGGANAEKARITSLGNFSLGTTTPTSQLDTTGTVRFRTLGAGTINADASGNLYSVSDEKLKTAKIAYNSDSSKIQSINPIQYKFIAASGLDTASTYTGVSAQNVQAAYPECVYAKQDGEYKTECGAEGEDCKTIFIPSGTQTLSVDDRCLIAVLFNAVKEQQQEIKELKTKLEGLKV